MIDRLVVKENKFGTEINVNNNENNRKRRTAANSGTCGFTKKSSLLTSDLVLALTKKLVKCNIWSIPLYGAEIPRELWTLILEKNRKKCGQATSRTTILHLANLRAVDLMGRRLVDFTLKVRKFVCNTKWLYSIKNIYIYQSFLVFSLTSSYECCFRVNDGQVRALSWYLNYFITKIFVKYVFI